jgi:arginine utilization protein RocB
MIGSRKNRQWLDEVRRMTEALVAIRSVSPNAENENKCAEQIKAFLSEGTELEPELWPTSDGRHNVACILEGGNPANKGKTIILVGHYDTVDIKEYSHLGQGEEIALNPIALQEVFSAEMDMGDDAHNWMYGRGSFDMKGAIATEIAIMRQLWRDRDDLTGNVVFVACPDEENESFGILTAVPRLVELCKKNGWQYTGVINADYTAPRGDNLSERYIYTGVVGKLLPSFYILGDTTHVSEPFRGVDPSQIASEIVKQLNLNSELCDVWQGEQGETEAPVPPMTLKLRDLKNSYNVQTAQEAFVYVNWLTHTRSPGDALQIMMGIARTSLNTVLEWRSVQHKRFVDLGGQEPTPKTYTPQVLSFSDLYQLYCAKEGLTEGDTTPLDQFAQEIQEQNEAYTKRFDESDKHHYDVILKNAMDSCLAIPVDNRESSRLLVAKMIEQVGLTGPAIIVFFSPPYYPHIQPQENEITTALAKVLDQLKDMDTVSDNDAPLKRKFLAAMAKFENPSIQQRGFYPYISDVSYVGLDESVQNQIDVLIENMPLFNRGYSLPFDDIRELNCPVVNIGPWGSDAHGLYERVHMPYSFEVVPQLIYETIHELLSLASS